MNFGYVELSVFVGSFTFVLTSYTVLISLLGVFSHLLLFGFLSCCIFGVLYRFHVPKPSQATVRSFFGRDWGCYSTNTGNDKSDDEYVMKVISHRACGLDAPENSLVALEKSTNAGITTAEFDVLLTSDDVPIIFHDVNLQRMTGLDVDVEKTSFKEIRKFDISVKHPFGKNFPKERIPTLDEFVRYCLDNQIRMILDLKGTKMKIIQAINDLFKQYPQLYCRAVVSSFNPVYVYKIRANDPKIICSLAWRPYFYSHMEFSQLTGPTHPRTNNFFLLLYLRLLSHAHEWALWNFGFYLLGISALLLHKDLITRALIKHWKKKGVRVIAWSVNLPTEKQYYEKILEITYLTDTAINS